MDTWIKELLLEAVTVGDAAIGSGDGSGDYLKIRDRLFIQFVKNLV
jgi:hypothetical protein